MRPGLDKLLLPELSNLPYKWQQFSNDSRDELRCFLITCPQQLIIEVKIVNDNLYCCYNVCLCRLTDIMPDRQDHNSFDVATLTIQLELESVSIKSFFLVEKSHFLGAPEKAIIYHLSQK